MKPISIEQARQLVDFEPLLRNGNGAIAGYGEDQIRGAVMAHNMIALNNCAYIADEVGLGKTYVALGVVGFIRHFNPKAKVVFLTPRENIQLKWIKELKNFVRINWRITDNRIKSLQGTPARESVYCGSLPDFAHALSLNNDRDFFLRMTSFSITSKEAEERKKHRKRIQEHTSWIPSHFLSTQDPVRFVEGYGQLLNAIIPPIDLLIVDEGHNLKHGLKGSNISTRNRMLANVFGRPREEKPDWYGPRIKSILFLSATPFEGDYAELYNQLDLFGFGDASVEASEGSRGIPIRRIADPSVDLAVKKEIVSRFMMRRISDIYLGGKRLTKNLYRREWRNGGYATHDEPMEISNLKQRLTVALVQKKVSEILQDERFNNSFQIGMLSSFESFLESMKRKRKRLEEEEATFDGDQEATREERKGIDTDVLENIIFSHREEFNKTLPHPKLDTTAEALKNAFQTGEKALVFVRRVATASELASKISGYFDEWIKQKMFAELPEHSEAIENFFQEYSRWKRGEERDIELPQVAEPDLEEDVEAEGADEEIDPNTFFSWFFRGISPPGKLTGAAFQKNRLSNPGSRYSILFEDDYVSWLLGYPADVFETLSKQTGLERALLREKLGRLAYNAFRRRTKRKVGYPVLYTLEAYQSAALQLLAGLGGEIGERATIVINERFPEAARDEEDPPPGFPDPEGFIGIKTFFPVLKDYPELRKAIWPEEQETDFRTLFRRREQRRELVGTLARLGFSYIDLYILAIRGLGSMSLREQSEGDRPEETLALDFIKLLEGQRATDSFSAFYELSEAARTFDLLLSVNFPDVPGAPLSEISKKYGATLQRQVPVAAMSGEVNKRVVRQFRMPGFPLVLVTTDVLQEGEDLHTFCMRVYHYGITWTPSAMEQRTGRVDRIGSLFHRNIHERGDSAKDEDFIQVYYPHLQDTIEVLQIRRVLERLNRFQRMIHDIGKETPDYDSTLDAGREFLTSYVDIAPIKEPLVSAFPIREEWLGDGTPLRPIHRVSTEQLEAHFRSLCNQIKDRFDIAERKAGVPHEMSGIIAITGSDPARHQPFRLQLIAHPTGRVTLLRCSSPIGRINLRNDAEVDLLYEIQRDLNQVKVCSSYNVKDRESALRVEGDILFDPASTQVDELEALLFRVTCASDAIEDRVLNRDDDPEAWIADEGEAADE